MELDLIRLLIPVMGMAASIGLLLFTLAKIFSDDNKKRYK